MNFSSQPASVEEFTTEHFGYYHCTSDSDKPVFKVTEGGGRECSGCPAGMKPDRYRLGCEACPRNQVSYEGGHLSCTKCPSGSSANIPQTRCMKNYDLVNYNNNVKYTKSKPSRNEAFSSDNYANFCREGASVVSSCHRPDFANNKCKNQCRGDQPAGYINNSWEFSRE